MKKTGGTTLKVKQYNQYAPFLSISIHHDVSSMPKPAW